MDSLHPWLTSHCLRQAYLAFDMDSPGDMPQRPILQVMKIGTSTVTMANRKQATVKCHPMRCAVNIGFNVRMAAWVRKMVLQFYIKNADLRDYIHATGYVTVVSYS